MNTQAFFTSLRYMLAAVFLLSAVSPAPGADQFLETCLKIAENRDKRLAAAREQLDYTSMMVTRTTRNFFPAVMAQRRYSRGKTGGLEEYQSEELGLKASQPIYQGGAQAATYRYDSMAKESARYGYTKTREELFLQVKLAYYELLSSKIELEALTKAFREIDKLQKKVQIEYNSKAIAELDLLEAENFRDKVENFLKSAEANHALARRKLLSLVNADSLENIPAVMPEGFGEELPEVSFTLRECLGFVANNSLDIKIARHQIQMAEQKRKIALSKVIPKIYLEGFYGQSGEAFIDEPLPLGTVWNIMGRLSWGLWGNSMEATHSQEKTNPSELLDLSSRIDVVSYDVKLSLLDDLNYFVDSKESKASYAQAQAEHMDAVNKSSLDLEKAYNEYLNSLRNVRTLRKEIALKERKLQLLRKRNELYEVPTVQVMEESEKYAEIISSYGRALYTNLASVAEMEKLTLMTLR